jgi:hypothetical protein
MMFEVVLAAMSNRIPWKETLVFPNSLIIYGWFLVAPCTTALTVSFVYFLKHQGSILRTSILAETFTDKFAPLNTG